VDNFCARSKDFDGSRSKIPNKMTRILCGNPVAQFHSHRQEILESIKRVLDNGPYILGPEVVAFEQKFAAYNDAKYCVGVGSGTDALVLAMKALDIGAEDEVITVSHTAVATVSAIVAIGATPVLVDIEEKYYTLDPNLIKPVITKKTKAIIPVHLYGQPCDMDAVMQIASKYGLYVIEDCAQAHGATYKSRKVGAMGDVGCFSFYPTKNLGAVGDGGAVITNNYSVSERIKRLRQYGWDKNRVSQESSTVSRLDELQATILRVKLEYLDDDNDKRRKAASLYDNKLANKGWSLPAVRPDSVHVYHLYVARVNDRQQVVSDLAKVGIDAGIHYSCPAHMHAGMKGKVYAPAPLTVTEKIVKEIMSLPIYPEVDAIHVTEVLKDV
jgi:dTDP-4-amino-4,6-dideoxygalactose transaminase